MVSYNKQNTINLTPKSTPFEAFDKINQVVLNGITDNMASLVQAGKYGIITTTETTTDEFYVIKFILEEYTIQSNTKIDGQVISDGGLVVKEQYPCSMQ